MIEHVAPVRSGSSTERSFPAGTTCGPEPDRAQPDDSAVSGRFAHLARRDTRPEVLLRQELFARGLRYRVQYKVPGLARRRIDIAFTRWRVAVQVDGCFWHGCPEHGTDPARNAEWWEWKINRNQERDRDTDAALASLGWTVVRVWEHDDPRTAASRIQQVIAGCRSGIPTRQRDSSLETPNPDSTQGSPGSTRTSRPSSPGARREHLDDVPLRG